MMKIAALISTICIFITSCSLFDKDEFIPAYLNIDGVNLSTGPSQGEPTHKITDVWVFADTAFLGVFELPASIPIITEGGSVPIEIFAGIRNNGLAENPIIYPFYEKVVTNLDLSAGEQINYVPDFTYKNNIVFEFVENFEGSNLFSDDIDGDPDTFIERSEEDVLSGTKSGKISLDSEHRIMESAMALFLERDDFVGGDVFVEIDYKTTVDLLVGIQRISNGNNEIEYYAGANPNTEWNKLYVDLTVALGSISIDQYRILISAGLPANRDSSTTYIDNIKLIHF